MSIRSSSRKRVPNLEGFADPMPNLETLQDRHANPLDKKHMRQQAEPCRTFSVNVCMCARALARGFELQENRFGGSAGSAFICKVFSQADLAVWLQSLVPTSEATERVRTLGLMRECRLRGREHRCCDSDRRCWGYTRSGGLVRNYSPSRICVRARVGFSIITTKLGTHHHTSIRASSLFVLLLPTDSGVQQKSY